MTHDPERLLSAHSDADPLERELLASVRGARAPAHAKEQAWSNISAQIAAGALATSALAPSTAAAASAGGSLATSAIATKVVLTLAIGSIAVGGYFAAQHRPTASETRKQRAPSTQAPAVGSQPRGVASQPPPAAQAVPAIQAAEPPRESAPTRAGVQSHPIERQIEVKREDRLTAEAALLARARSALRSGETADARTLLDQLAAKFPKGVLVQEREVLAIEVLSTEGDLATAKRRAQAFVKAHPQSPHSPQLRRLLDTP